MRADYQRKAWKAELDTLVRLKRLNKADADRAYAAAKGKDARTISRWRKRLNAEFFDYELISDVRRWAQARYKVRP